MSSLTSRLADKMLGIFAPRVTAEAGCVWYSSSYCYCSGGIAYRRVTYKCTNPDGSVDYIMYPCDPSGTC
jgi:hypothetical protein